MLSARDDKRHCGLSMTKLADDVLLHEHSADDSVVVVIRLRDVVMKALT